MAKESGSGGRGGRGGGGNKYNPRQRTIVTVRYSGMSNFVTSNMEEIIFKDKKDAERYIENMQRRGHYVSLRNG